MRSRLPYFVTLIAVLLCRTVSADAQFQFTALEFFRHQHAGEKITPTRPERVHYRSAKHENLEGALIGSWTYLLTCSGRPLQVEEVLSPSYSNGVTTSFNVMEFKDDGTYESWVHSGREQGFQPRRLNHISKWAIRGDELIEGKLAFHSMTFKFIQETGELVMVMPMPEDKAICRSSENAEMIGVRVPTH